MEYQITTIKDIFDNIPVNKIEQCVKEIGFAMVQAKHMESILCKIATDDLGKEVKSTIDWPAFFQWVDDDNGDVELNFEFADGNNINLKITG